MKSERSILVSADTPAAKSLAHADARGVDLWPVGGLQVESLSQFLRGKERTVLSPDIAWSSTELAFVRYGEWAWGPGRSLWGWVAALRLVAPDMSVCLSGDNPASPANAELNAVLQSLMHAGKKLGAARYHSLRVALHRFLFGVADPAIFAPLGQCCDLEFAVRWRRDSALRQSAAVLEPALTGEPAAALPDDVKVMWPRLCQGYEVWFDKNPDLTLAETRARLELPLAAWVVENKPARPASGE